MKSSLPGLSILRSVNSLQFKGGNFYVRTMSGIISIRIIELICDHLACIPI